MNPHVLDIRPAAPADLQPAIALLESVNLPVQGVPTAFVHFRVARWDGVFAGLIGAEYFETDGLLRSLAVEQGHRGKGIGRQLCNALLAAGNEKGVRRWYLLTETAEPFFISLGFEAVPRHTASIAVRNSEEFSSICPDSATAMCLNFD